MKDRIDHSLDIIRKSIKEFPRIAVASSFGKDSIVTLHLCLQVNPDIKVFSIITPYKFKETLEYKDKMTRLWNLNIATYQAEFAGPIYERDTNECCTHYKVKPTIRAIKELKLDAWICGLRATEGTEHRKFTEEIEERYGLWKINPILKWTEANVWLYHSLNNIPPNPLYGRGYRSLGCEPCSEPYTEEERGGRWINTPKIECGIHTVPLREKGKF